MSGELKHRAHSVGQNCYHLVWCPKFRAKLFRPLVVRKVCEGVLRLIAMKKGFVIHDMRIMSDHVHLFVEIPPFVSVSQAFQSLKGISSRVMRKHFPYFREYKRLWGKGKFYRSVGNVTRDVVEHYIVKSHDRWTYFDEKRLYIDERQSLLSTY